MTGPRPGAVLILSLLVLFTLQPAAAREKKEKKAGKPRKAHELHLYLEPQGAMVYGEQDEFVFWESSKNSNDGMVSKLEWQERNMKLYGGKVGFSFDRLGAEFQIHAAVKGESGEMYDSDWLNQDDVKTHYSINKNTLNSCFMLSFLTYFDFHPFRNFTQFSLAPTAEFAYKNLLFSSDNKEGWYGIQDENGTYAAWNSGSVNYYPSKYAVLCGIDYEKIAFYGFLGVRTKLDLFNDRLHLALGGAVAPYVYAKAEDKHYHDLERKKYDLYNDFIDVFFKTFKGNFSTFFDINDILSIGLNGEALVSLTSRGILNQYDGRKEVWLYYDGTDGGVSEYNFQLGIGLRFNIF